MSGNRSSNPRVSRLRAIANRLRDSGRYGDTSADIADASEVDGAADEIENLERLFRQAIRDMESCACEWEVDDDGERTDKIASLCRAHEEVLEKVLAPKNTEIERLTAERDTARKYRKDMEANIDRLRGALRVLLNAAQSWHDFHHGSKTIQCDAICEAIPRALKALDGPPSEPGDANG